MKHYQERIKDSEFKEVWVPNLILLLSLYLKREGGNFLSKLTAIIQDESGIKSINRALGSDEQSW